MYKHSKLPPSQTITSCRLSDAPKSENENFMTHKFSSRESLKTAILFLVFNRPDTTEQVFQEIRKVAPPRLYVAADGPREGNDTDDYLVQKTREIATNIDWPCEVKTLFRDQNLGAKYAISDALSWFFKYEEQGIILEDDCLPSQSFFWFCETLLDHYKHDESVSHICGRVENVRSTAWLHHTDCFKTSRGFTWGWATWKSVANDFDVDWISKNSMLQIVRLLWTHKTSYTEFFYRLSNVISVKCNLVDAWDYPWNTTQLIRGRRCILPRVNLIKNIGFGENATHTKQGSDNTKLNDISFPLRKECIIDDDYTVATILKHRSFLRYLVSAVASNILKAFRCVFRQL
ncbi:hypothetical protein [Halorhodospira halochloris]|uniref:hypothetical protein n=1 Tax=Halorhodospira halochloris TaxID=1052 RepID=UPI001EE8797F|nr:hypothetical protein [Halorhodospira halochloris]MCG5548942.1 hypothetical protein [Halorhodospira halochloris]